MYAGIGYDAHRFKEGRDLVLGGVKIAHKAGLEGHSDADVPIHALMDALLGAAGLSDIGHLFPNTDPAFKDASSVKLLEKVARELDKKWFRVNNVDITLIAEAPAVAPHISAMKKNISCALKLPVERIGITATSNEGMGFIGRGEGIAAIAVASISSVSDASE